MSEFQGIDVETELQAFKTMLAAQSVADFLLVYSPPGMGSAFYTLLEEYRRLRMPPNIFDPGFVVLEKSTRVTTVDHSRASEE